MNDKTTITVGKNTHKDLMLIKINCRAKNLDDVIQKILKEMKTNLNKNEKVI